MWLRSRADQHSNVVVLRLIFILALKNSTVSSTVNAKNIQILFPLCISLQAFQSYNRVCGRLHTAHIRLAGSATLDFQNGRPLYKTFCIVHPLHVETEATFSCIHGIFASFVVANKSRISSMTLVSTSPDCFVVLSDWATISIILSRFKSRNALELGFLRTRNLTR